MLWEEIEIEIPICKLFRFAVFMKTMSIPTVHNQIQSEKNPNYHDAAYNMQPIPDPTPARGAYTLSEHSACPLHPTAVPLPDATAVPFTRRGFENDSGGPIVQVGVGEGESVMAGCAGITRDSNVKRRGGSVGVLSALPFTAGEVVGLEVGVTVTVTKVVTTMTVTFSAGDEDEQAAGMWEIGEVDAAVDVGGGRPVEEVVAVAREILEDGCVGRELSGDSNETGINTDPVAAEPRDPESDEGPALGMSGSGTVFVSGVLVASLKEKVRNDEPLAVELIGIRVVVMLTKSDEDESISGTEMPALQMMSTIAEPSKPALSRASTSTC